MHKETKTIIFQILLFVTTFITTTLAGAEFCFAKSIYRGDEAGNIYFNSDFTWADFASGLSFSIPLMLILTVHEFGHYFMALFHKVRASLPYYIPVPPIPGIPSLMGTMGAVIRLKDRPHSNLQNFDIGLAGPLAGFIVALAVMFYGFLTLPPPEYVFQFHPEYEKFGVNYAEHVYSNEYIENLKKETGSESGFVIDVTIGTNLIFWIFEKTIADPARVPNAHELMHYPVLLAAYIALFVTCLNLLPIGQLDGGHVVYGLFGFKIHKIIASVFFIALIFYAGLGLSYLRPEYEFRAYAIPVYILFLYMCLKGLQLSQQDTIMYALILFAIQFVLIEYVPSVTGYEGWILFVFIIGRFIGVQHPPSEIEQPLDSGRVVLGWLTLIIFILCFSPAPITMELK